MPVSRVYPQISEAIYTNVYAVLQGDMGASQMDEEIQQAVETFQSSRGSAFSPQAAAHVLVGL